jgi:hypothetical protein
MQILQLSTLGNLKTRNPYYVLGRYEAVEEILAVAAQAYATTDGRYPNVHIEGMVRYGEMAEGLSSATKRFSTRIVNRGGQHRLIWSGMDGSETEMIILHGKPDGDRFITSKRGIRSQQHSQLDELSLSSDDGEAMVTGSYIFHHEDSELGCARVWFVAKGRTRIGWDYVLVDEAVDLGSIRYRNVSEIGDDPVDIEP